MVESESWEVEVGKLVVVLGGRAVRMGSRKVGSWAGQVECEAYSTCKLRYGNGTLPTLPTVRAARPRPASPRPVLAPQPTRPSTSLQSSVPSSRHRQGCAVPRLGGTLHCVGAQGFLTDGGLPSCAGNASRL